MKKTTLAFVAVLSIGPLLALLDAQPPQPAEPSAKSAIKALADKLDRADNNEKESLPLLMEYEEAARELRNTNWLPRLLNPRESSAVKVQVLKTMATIGDPSYVFLATKALDDPDEQTRAYAANTLWQLQPSRDP